ncbi:hypothetical protein C0993_006345 [Termitomyces sp. T159_Od127]|nr:hypothetical protein C0993_006345 [Termitomyces sp. T159_Od127]
MSTIHQATYWAYVRRAFIAHGETAESIADALNEYPVWFIGITSVSDANAVLADVVIATFSIIAIFKTVTSTTFGPVGVDYATALYSTSLITTSYCTAAIVYRVTLVSNHSRVGYGLRSYRGVIEILVESSALYFLATLFVLVAYICSGPASEFASAFWTSITGIAPTLVIARVAAGEARPNETWNGPHQGPVLSFLRFKNKIYGNTHTELGIVSTGTRGTGAYDTGAYGGDLETSVLPRGPATWELHLQQESSAV